MLQKILNHPAPDGYIEVRNASGHLLFRFNRAKQQIQIKHKGRLPDVVDLAPLLADENMEIECTADIDPR